MISLVSGHINLITNNYKRQALHKVYRIITVQTPWYINGAWKKSELVLLLVLQMP